MDDIRKKLKFFELAKEINEKNKDCFLSNQVHCRGSLNSMSLISVSNEKPELGFSAIKTEKTILAKMEMLKSREKPKRKTPEKVLQAWIIRNAMSNNYELSFNRIKFITSEMAIKNKKNGKVVNDILGFSEEDGIWIIELKSKRSLQELIGQVNDFEETIKENQNFFYELLKIHHCDWDKKSIKKAIVWPYNKNAQQSTIEQLSNKNIIEYGYIKEEDSFRIIKM